LSILAADDFYNRPRREFSGVKRIVNSFAGKRFYNASSVTDNQKILVGAGDRRPGKRRDGTPALIGGDFELALSPLSGTGNGGWLPNEAKSTIVFVNRGLTGVAFSKELQDNFLVKI